MLKVRKKSEANQDDGAFDIQRLQRQRSWHPTRLQVSPIVGNHVMRYNWRGHNKLKKIEKLVQENTLEHHKLHD